MVLLFSLVRIFGGKDETPVPLCITVKVLRADGDQIKIGIEAPSRVTVNRKEVQRRMEKPRLRGGLSTFPECQQPTVVIGLTE